MKKGMLVLFGAILCGFASCGGGESTPAEGADTTHTEGDSHYH